MASPSPSGKDLSSLWHTFAPPPPPASPGPGQDSRRRSVSYQAEHGARSRHDTLPPSSFSPAPDRPVSRNSNMARSASPNALSASTNMASIPLTAVAPAFDQAGRPLSQDLLPGGQAQSRTLARVRHDSAPIIVNGSTNGSFAPRAYVQNGTPPPQVPHQPLNAQQVGPSHVQRSNSAQSYYTNFSPVAYGVPQAVYQQDLPLSHAMSPVSPGTSALSVGYVHPQQPQHQGMVHASRPAHGHPRALPQHFQADYAPLHSPANAPVAAQAQFGPYAYQQVASVPAGYVPPEQQPIQFAATAGSPTNIPGYQQPAYAAYPQTAIHQVPQHQSFSQQPFHFANPAAGHPPSRAPFPQSQSAVKQQALPPAVLPQQSGPSSSLPPSSPEKYSIRHPVGAMGPPAALASAMESAGAGPRSNTSRPLPQPGRSFSLNQANPNSTYPIVGENGHASSPSVASSVGSVRRTLPQPPIGTSPAIGDGVAGSGSGSNHATAVPANLLGTLNRTESMRLAAEALMSRGPPRRAGIGLGGLRSRMNSQVAADRSPTAAEASAQQESEEIPPALASSQSDPTTWTSTLRDTTSLDSVMQNLRDITLGSPSLKSQSPTRKDTSAQAVPADPMRIEESAAAAAFAPPDRPRSRGAHHSIRQVNEERKQAQPSFANTPVSPPAHPDVVADRPKSPGPEGQSEARTPSPAPARYETFATPAQPAPPAIIEPSTIPEVRLPQPPQAPSTISVGRPQMFEPSQQAPRAPPTVPTISLPGDDDVADDGCAPGIVISVSDEEGTHAPPIISISEDDDGAAGPAISVSGTKSEIPSAGTPAEAQRATSGFAHPPPSSSTGPASASSVGSGATCGGCRKWIGGRVVQAMGLTWHPQCFRCSHCGQHLEHFAFYEHEGRPYCHVDYHELFSRRCFHCRTPIVDERFILIDDEQLGKRYYHDLHFFCANCGDPFVDPKAAAGTAGADEQALVADEQGIVQAGGKAFVVVKGYPYCEKCHVNLHHPRCKGCKLPITDDLITALKGKWHPHCFVCESCKQPFEGERFFEKDGKAWDEECYKVMLRNTL